MAAPPNWLILPECEAEPAQSPAAAKKTYDRRVIYLVGLPYLKKENPNGGNHNANSRSGNESNCRPIHARLEGAINQ
jgi:hypothetical protein